MIACLSNEGHLEKLLADKKLDEGKRKEYESVIGQVIHELIYRVVKGRIIATV